MAANYQRGRRAEHRAIRILEADGFCVSRAAGSKGHADVIAWNSVQVRFIQVKAGKSPSVSAVEREALELMPRPQNATVEVWRFKTGCRQPLQEVL